MRTGLTRTDSIDSGDLFVILKGDDSDYRAVSQSVVLAWIQKDFRSTELITQAVSPGDGFTSTISDGSDTWLLITPTGDLTNGIIILPSSAQAADGQVILVTTTRQILSITVTSVGATVNGAPLVLAADDDFKLKYNTQALAWYKVS